MITCLDVYCTQDGSVELSVPSTELFPIHHLDELEFFPCDFVVSTSGKAIINKYLCKIVPSSNPKCCR